MRTTRASQTIALGLLLIGTAAAKDPVALRAALASCGPAGVHFQTIHSPSPQPAEAEKGKARILLVGDAAYAIDGRWVAKTTGNTYFAVSLDPGEHHLCARYSHWLPWEALIFIWTKVTVYSVHSLDAKAEETYYFGPRGNPLNPPAIAVFHLIQYDSDEGARIVAASKFRGTRPK